MSGIVFLIILFCIFAIRKVPPNTVIIIDKNSHYLKTKKSGYYLMLPNYKITTQISTNKLFRTLHDFYETYDGKPAVVSITCGYNSINLDSTIEALASVRRSVDDILKSSVYFAVKNYTSYDVNALTEDFKMKVYDNMRLELDTIGVVLSNFTIRVNIVQAPSANLVYFKPHVSSHDVCNTNDYSDCSSRDFGINDEDPNADPIKFY